MKKAIIGKKIGMTQIFDENGRVIPVTVVEAGPCVVDVYKRQALDCAGVANRMQGRSKYGAKRPKQK